NLLIRSQMLYSVELRSLASDCECKVIVIYETVQIFLKKIIKKIKSIAALDFVESEMRWNTVFYSVNMAAKDVITKSVNDVR
ncbi:MAG: hypothetical protein J1F10_04950, partial [Muribaculaceae bacterium]|nr:hypothetical protein [Muribaculaceae bacterium]